MIAKGKLPESTKSLFDQANKRQLYKRVHVFYASSEEGRTRETDYTDAKARRTKEDQICRDVSNLPDWQSKKLNNWDILIDVAKPANFKVEIKGVYFNDPPPHEQHVVPWDKKEFVSHFDTSLLTEMESGIRKVRIFYNPNNPKGTDLREILRNNRNLY
jgi:hypothetical protein